jgi:hypothetical protein
VWCRRGLIAALASTTLKFRVKITRDVAGQNVKLSVGENLNSYPVAVWRKCCNVFSARKAVGDFVIREAHMFQCSVVQCSVFSSENTSLTSLSSVQ